MILIGNNLGERHQDLNSKVSEAVAEQINFEELKSQPEKCDVDKLFKIALASKYKNIDYIMEVLKCGDKLYITKALNCSWMYTDEYSEFINTDYLEANIFTNMSIKMKKKMLTAISIHVRNGDRVIDFYTYCINARLKDYAIKFLVFTPDSFKINLLQERQICRFRDSKVLKQFIGRSFDVARAFLEENDYSSSIIQELRFLYSVSEEGYLNILEHIHVRAAHPHHFTRRLGIRLSKSILNKHKQRVLNKPLLYVNVLHKGMIEKYLTTGDVELLAPSLLPDNSREYWSLNFYNTYKFIIDKIPAIKLYNYMKLIFVSKYDEVEFEMDIEFYRLKYYEMLNVDEREAWALQHIERDRELPGIKNYIWYKFVSFLKAFSGIKRYIFLTPDKDERSRIVNVLPETARNQEDIKVILNYYYGRHVNESENHKESFINKMFEIHDINSFDDECWTTFDKLLHSLDVYTTASYVRSDYKFRSLVYHILHGKDMPEALKEYVEQMYQFYHLESIIEELTEDRKAIVAKYLLNNCAEKIEILLCHPDYNKVSEADDHWNSNSIKNQVQEVVCKIWCIIYCFKRADEDCPAIAVQFMESNMDVYQYHEKYKPKFEITNEEDFVRWLKQDKEMAVDGISEIRCNTYRWKFRLCRLFRKLKVYFPQDVTIEYLNYFNDYLSDVPKGRREYRNIKMAVVGVFCLADSESIISFLDKNVPTSPKIEHDNIDNRVLQVQKAICRLSYHPRPPLPLSTFQKYITGDYVHYCLPVFYNYFATLPSSTQFIDSLLDAPLSIQKHGLRFAFRSYDAETLSPIIKSAWKKTKNVSLRMVLYETLFNRILNEKNEVQKQLYEVLKLYTSELNHDDTDNIYSLLISDNFPDTLKGDFIETSWRTVSNLSNKSVDIQRRISIVRHMEKYIHLVQRDFVRQIIDEHVKDMLCKKSMKRDRDQYEFQQLTNAKWQISARYIVSFDDAEEQQKSLQLLQEIMTQSAQSWNFINEFIQFIMDKDPKTIKSCENIIPIYVCILNIMKSFYKTEEMYLLRWKLALAITGRHIIHNGIRSESDSETDKPRNMSSREIAHAFGEAVAKIVRRSVKNNVFSRCFYEFIADIVNNAGCTICDILDVDSSGNVYYVCESLIKTKLTETQLLALYMLPRNPGCYWESEHRAIKTDIHKKSVSQEVRSFWHHKFRG